LPVDPKREDGVIRTQYQPHFGGESEKGAIHSIKANGCAKSRGLWEIRKSLGAGARTFSFGPLEAVGGGLGLSPPKKEKTQNSAAIENAEKRKGVKRVFRNGRKSAHLGDFKFKDWSGISWIKEFAEKMQIAEISQSFTRWEDGPEESL